MVCHAPKMILIHFFSGACPLLSSDQFYLASDRCEKLASLSVEQACADPSGTLAKQTAHLLRVGLTGFSAGAS